VKLLKTFLVIFSLLIITPQAYADSIGGKSIRAIANSDIKTASGIFENQTILMKRLPDRSGYNKDKKGIPVTGTFVAYLAKNGQILIWSKDSSKVITGIWAIVNTKENKPRMMFCMRFSKNKEKVPCMLMKYIDGVFFDSEKGNIFNLRKGASVPAPLPYSRNLSTIRNKIK